MKTLRVPLALLFCSMVAVSAQTPAPDAATTSAPTPSSVEEATPAIALRSDEELEQLLAPIALYPDALIALILPAAIVPADIVLAARHLKDFPDDRSQIEHRAWDESVKSLTHYPEVLQWMDENLQWTKQVGEAFLAQPADVMQAVQRLRAKARAAGTLVDTPQQHVIAEADVVRIVPAQPDVIYVPRYEPDIVFVDRPVFYPQPLLTFGVGVSVGSWLAYDCDWRRRTIWCGDRHRRWTRHDWRRPLLPVTPGFAKIHRPPAGIREWRPPGPHTTYHVVHRRHHPVIRPHPLGRPRTSGPHAPYADRDIKPTYARSFSAQRLPAAPALPQRATTSDAEIAGPHAPATIVRAPRTAAPGSVSPSENRRRSGYGFIRNGERSRTWQRSEPPAALPLAPALPMASAAQPAPVAGPTVSHSFTRTPRNVSAPRSVPSLPMAHVATPPAASVTAPAVHRPYQRASIATRSAPALPMAQSSTPAATVAPRASSPPPRSAVTPSRGDGGSRHHGRRGESQSEN